MPKKTTAKKTSKRKTAKKPSSRSKSTKKAPSRATAKKTTKRKATGSKKASKRKSTKKSTGGCSKKSCKKKSCSARVGGSLIDRARDCQNLEECRRFIAELIDGAEQANTWLNDMHSQALSAEKTRDLYAEQISDLVEAIDIDHARIAKLEAELKKARQGAPKSAASDAVLRKLGDLSREVRAIRADLERLAKGIEPPRRGRRPSKKKVPTSSTASKLSDHAFERQRQANETEGRFAKYSVLRGAACSLGVGKHGYPPEVCAPAYFNRSEAAEILGTYAQNDYGGLAKWALITGFPIDDGGRTATSVAVPLPSTPAAASKSKRKAKPKKSTSPRKKKAAKRSSRKAPSTPPSAAQDQPRKTAASGRSSQQILDQVLLTIARI